MTGRLIATVALSFSAAGAQETCSPELLSVLGGLAQHIHVEGSIAYVASVESGLYIYDVSRPEAPVLHGVDPTSIKVFDMSVSDGVAYLAQDQMGVRVVDVSDPMCASPSYSL